MVKKPLVLTEDYGETEQLQPGDKLSADQRIEILETKFKKLIEYLLINGIKLDTDLLK